jgi:hypothetical protein
MPKSPRVSTSKDLRHDPLEREYSWSESTRQKAPKKRKQRQDNDADADQVVDTRAAQKILRIGQDLADEDEQERKSKYVSGSNEGLRVDSRLQLEQEEEELEGQDEDTWEDEDNQDMEVEETDPNDLDVFNKFNPPAFDDPILHNGLHMGLEPEETQTRNLADIILAKIALHEAGESGEPLPDDMLEEEVAELPPKVQEVYTKFVTNQNLILHIANIEPELVTYCHDTNPASSQKPSKSLLPSHLLCKTPSSPSPVLKTGLRTPYTKPPKSSYQVLRQPHNLSSPLSCLIAYGKMCKRTEN